MQLLKRKCEFKEVHSYEENLNLVQHSLWESNGTALNICEAKVMDILPY